MLDFLYFNYIICNLCFSFCQYYGDEKKNEMLGTEDIVAVVESSDDPCAVVARRKARYEVSRFLVASALSLSCPLVSFSRLDASRTVR